MAQIQCTKYGKSIGTCSVSNNLVIILQLDYLYYFWNKTCDAFRWSDFWEIFLNIFKPVGSRKKNLIIELDMNTQIL